MGKPDVNMDIESLKARRTKDRSKATKLSNDLKRLFTQVDQGGKNEDRYDLDYTIELGEEHLSQMQGLNARLSELGVEDDSSHIAELHRAIGLGKRLLKDTQRQAAPSEAQNVVQTGFKLNFSLPRFNGDLLAWPEFWELYEASVERNDAYSPVQKLYYLKQHLDGAAARSIQGLQLTAENYPVAIQILKDRFGKSDLRKDNIIAKILSLPAVGSTDNLKSLRRLVDDVSAGINSLKTLNVEHAGDVLLPVLKGKIPPSWRLQWARQQDNNAPPEQDDFSRFVRFMQKEVQYLEEAAQVPCSKAGDEASPPLQKATTSVLNTQRAPAPPNPKPCPICKEGKHRLDRCSRYLEMAVDDRWTSVKRVGACFRCLGRHFARDCRSGNCRQCQGSHHTSLHRPQSTAPVTTPPPPPPTSYAPYSAMGQLPPPVSSPAVTPSSLLPTPRPDPASPSSSQQSHPNNRYTAQSTKPKCFIQTALVEGQGPRGKKMLRVLLDGGSDASYIRNTVAEELGLEVIGTDTFACIGFQERAEEPRTYNRVEIDLQNRHGGEVKRFELWCCDRLCAPLPQVELSAGLHEDILLADDFKGGPVDLLIGTDQYYKAVLRDCVEVSESLRALDTIFGYVIHGRDSTTGQPTRQVYHCRQVERMWDLDSIGISPSSERKKPLSDPEWNPAEQRYEMGLLWSSEKRPITNVQSSSIRVQRMTEKLDPEEFQTYTDNIIKLKQDGVVENSRSVPDEMNAFFLPHRGVYRNSKLRIVFDGSAKDGNGVSLNEYLEPGENLLRRLVGVLLNFRTHPVACQADIQAAFHQVAVKEEDRQYLQFIWAGDVLRFRRVPFGITCSPYMLLRTIEAHLSQYEDAYPELCRKIAAGLYMDDIAVGFQSIQEANTEMSVVQNMFHDAGMEMHKIRLSRQPSEDSKILGMRWNTEHDTLAVTLPDSALPKTKRQLLSVIAQPFDPLGILSPWIIKGKILFQQTWCDTKCSSWNSELPLDIRVSVEKWWQETESVREIQIPRSIHHLREETSFMSSATRLARLTAP